MIQPGVQRFIRRLTSRQVVIDDPKTGERKLAAHVEAALSKCPKKTEALDRCLNYLEQCEEDLRIKSPWNSWEITQKDPRQIGTLACIQYMKKRISQIRSLIVLDEIFGNK